MNNPKSATQRIHEWVRIRLGRDHEDDIAPDESGSGCIFCLSNPFMPGLVYIGATVRPMDKALKDLNRGIGSGTGLGEPEDFLLPKFELEWFEQIDDVWATEDELKRKLNYYVDAEESTYFRCSPRQAHSKLKTLIGPVGGNQPM